MKFPFSWFIGLRYTRAKRKNHFISFIALASMLGIALGVMVLITVMSVMNGFERELKERILGTVPHVVIGQHGDGVSDWQSLAAKASKLDMVVAASPQIESASMFKSSVGGTTYGLIKGVLPDFEQQVSIIENFMVSGSLNDLEAKKYRVVIGSSLARNLGVWVGDKITLLVVDGTTVSPAGIAPRYRRFTVVGIFETKSDLDGRIAMVHLSDAAKLLRKQDKVDTLQLKIKDIMKAQTVSTRLRVDLGYDYWVSDWNRTQGPLFRAIQMEKNMMFILLTLIIAVAAFNIVSTMVMVVTDKQADIAIMRTLGASPLTMMRIFMVQGSVNGVFGTILGVICGVLLASNLPEIVQWFEQNMGVSLVPGDVYFIGFLPSEVQMSDVVNITIAAMLMSVVATLYPAWRAAKTKPAEALKYE
ncbi:MAG: lipoprotein-releasing ABC transporter permease subunit [Kangiellaceae bacterium]|jgi:lipoprotein-releasing system permease protein|nr:lipoprotein-releasing ABC transporter permease subunit [Kangiellaceae bacterium]